MARQRKCARNRLEKLPLTISLFEKAADKAHGTKLGKSLMHEVHKLKMELRYCGKKRK